MSVITITKENFQTEVMMSDKPVLIDLWASWCGPCQMLSPLVDQVAEERNDIKVGKINVDENPELTQAFGVQSIPLLVLVKNGKITAQSLGYVPKEKIIQLIDS